MIPKIKLIIFFVIFGLYSCQKSEMTDVDFFLKKYTIYLKSGLNSDANLPPSYNMTFYIKNGLNQNIVFISKSSKYDKQKSNLYLLDTTQNIILPLYSSSRDIVKSNSSCEINATINIRDFRKYFHLKDTFFTKFDYTSQKSMLNKLFIDMLNRSIIIYEQDSSDVLTYKLFDKNVKSLPPNKIIKIDKDNFSYEYY